MWEVFIGKCVFLEFRIPLSFKMTLSPALLSAVLQARVNQAAPSLSHAGNGPRWQGGWAGALLPGNGPGLSSLAGLGPTQLGSPAFSPTPQGTATPGKTT